MVKAVLGTLVFFMDGLRFTLGEYRPAWATALAANSLEGSARRGAAVNIKTSWRVGSSS